MEEGKLEITPQSINQVFLGDEAVGFSMNLGEYNFRGGLVEAYLLPRHIISGSLAQRPSIEKIWIKPPNAKKKISPNLIWESYQEVDLLLLLVVIKEKSDELPAQLLTLEKVENEERVEFRFWHHDRGDKTFSSSIIDHLSLKIIDGEPYSAPRYGCYPASDQDSVFTELKKNRLAYFKKLSGSPLFKKNGKFIGIYHGGGPLEAMTFSKISTIISAFPELFEVKRRKVSPPLNQKNLAEVQTSFRETVIGGALISKDLELLMTLRGEISIFKSYFIAYHKKRSKAKRHSATNVQKTEEIIANMEDSLKIDVSDPLHIIESIRLTKVRETVAIRRELKRFRKEANHWLSGKKINYQKVLRSALKLGSSLDKEIERFSDESLHLGQTAILTTNLSKQTPPQFPRLDELPHRDTIRGGDFCHQSVTEQVLNAK